MDISVVVPLLNEAESLPELYDWIVRVTKTHQLSYEILFIDDGSKDGSWDIIQKLSAADASVRGIRFRRNYGKSAALNVGFGEAQGDVVITMDADLQDSPDEIPELHRMIMAEGNDLVSGWKKKRYDNALTKNLPSKLFNYTNRVLSGVKLHDMNCGLKAYRNDVVKNIEVYGEMHRYIPVIAKAAGFTKITEKVVEHRARKYGKSKFGLERFVNGFLDLTTILFMSRFGKKPMHFFGVFGILAFLLGFGIATWLLIEKMIHVIQGTRAPLVADSALFYIGLVSMIIGVQLFLAGFLGELISRMHPDRNHYSISETTYGAA
ncbi:MAG: glycosyltransferase family 2 protein [Bacteroidetes bacterium]|nr:glycosyltransferase family 2 protein [Bacteroidota bacterium]